jgi:hypothetical protein
LHVFDLHITAKMSGLISTSMIDCLTVSDVGLTYIDRSIQRRLSRRGYVDGYDSWSSEICDLLFKHIQEMGVDTHPRLCE